MKSPKPAHQVTLARIRLSLHAASGGSDHRHAHVTIERRQDPNTEGWYPAATYAVAELDALNEAIAALKAHLHQPANRPSRNRCGQAGPTASPGAEPVKPPAAFGAATKPDRRHPAAPPQPTAPASRSAKPSPRTATARTAKPTRQIKRAAAKPSHARSR